MKINGNAIRPGNVIEHNDRIWQAVKIQHTQPGKGGAYLQVELKDMRSGTKLNERFRAAETVERVRLDDDEYQFLFADGDQFTFMDTETYDQITLDRAIIGDQAVYLQDGTTATVQSYEGEPLTVVLAETVILEVSETEAVIKGQTASGSFKPAILENGVRTMVPPHIAMGTRVVISTADGAYRERARD
jgi:elongation factor P